MEGDAVQLPWRTRSGKSGISELSLSGTGGDPRKTLRFRIEMRGQERLGDPREARTSTKNTKNTKKRRDKVGASGDDESAG